MDEELREKIACKLCESNNKATCTTPNPDPHRWICKAWLSKADQILSLLKEADYVKLPPDSAILEGISNLKNLGSED